MRTLSLSLFFFFNSSSRSVLSRGDDIERIIFIFESKRRLFYNGFDLMVVVVASIFVKRRTSRARASLLVSLLFLRFSFEKERCSLVSRDLI